MLEPAHEPGCLGRRVGDLAGVALHLGGRVLVRDDEARVAGDRSEEVVQVMRNRTDIGPVLRLLQVEEMRHGYFFGRKRGPL